MLGEMVAKGRIWHHKLVSASRAYLNGTLSDDLICQASIYKPRSYVQERNFRLRLHIIDSRQYHEWF
jgi:hypothetical protein